METEDLLTLAEAAARVGISERALRDVLKRPEYAERTVRVTRQTKTGNREALMVPSALAEAVYSERGTRNGAGKNAGTTLNPEPVTFHVPRSVPQSPPAPDTALVDELRAQVADLKAQRERADAERVELLRALQTAQENLSREQALRLNETRYLPAVEGVRQEGPGASADSAAAEPQPDDGKKNAGGGRSVGDDCEFAITRNAQVAKVVISVG